MTGTSSEMATDRSRVPWVVCAIAAPILIVTFTLGWINGSVAEDPEFIYVAIVMMAGYIGVGAVVASRAPRNAVGWLMMAVGLGFMSAAFTDEYLTFAQGRPGGAPLVRVVHWFAAWSLAPAMVAFPFIVLLFPDGRVLSPRWRWVVRVGVAAGAVAIVVPMFAPGPISEISTFATNPLGIDALEPVVGPLLAVAYVALVSVIAAALVSIVLRWRRSEGVERQQIRLFTGVVVLASLLFVGTFATSVGGSSPLGDLTWLAFFVTLGIGVPVTMGVAILRYRMYDVEVVIRKTVVFGIVLVLIMGVSLLALFALSGPLTDLAPDETQAVAAVMFVVGLLIWPIWKLGSRIADRLVFGGRASPYEILTDFSHRMGKAYATEDVLPRMAQILGSALGAERAEVWIRVDGELRPAASWPSGDPPDGPPQDPVPVVDAGEEIGALTVRQPANDPMDPSKERLMADLAAQAGPVLRNVRLVADLRESRRRIVAAQDERARRLERDIHDGAQQQLVALAVQLRLARTLVDRDAAKAGEMLDALQTAAGDALDDLRDLARGIYPPLLADQGLAAALEAQARKAAVPTSVTADGIGRYPQDVEAAVYFCALEALNNVAKYSEASQARIELVAAGGWVTFSVSDNGQGFDMRETSFGTGLQGMRDRLDAIDGTIEIRSEPGAGTIVTGNVLVRSPAEEAAP